MSSTILQTLAVAVERNNANGILFYDESDVRRFVRDLFGENVYWVEQAPGSTHGFPDCYIAVGGRSLLLELKFGSVKDDQLIYKVRAEQKIVARRLASQGLGPFWLIGIESTRRLMLRPTHEITLSGKVELS